MDLACFELLVVVHIHNLSGHEFTIRLSSAASFIRGADTLPFGDRLAAVPMSGLWS